MRKHPHGYRFEITTFRSRRYQAIPIAKIKVINSRSRDQEQFDMNVESINKVGLLKRVRVNDKFRERTGMYELICGEGRLTAQQKLGQTAIAAEIVTCTRKEAYLQSLVENVARTKSDSMDFALETKRLYDDGLVTTNNFAQAREIISARARDPKSKKRPDTGEVTNEIKGYAKKEGVTGKPLQAATDTPPWQQAG